MIREKITITADEISDNHGVRGSGGEDENSAKLGGSVSSPKFQQTSTVRPAKTDSPAAEMFEERSFLKVNLRELNQDEAFEDEI